MTQLELACVTQANRICEIYLLAGDSVGKEPLGAVQQTRDGDDHNQSRKVIKIFLDMQIRVNVNSWKN